MNLVFFLPEQRNKVICPLITTHTVSRIDVDAYVRGGGFMGQASAVKLAISRALLLWNPQLKDLLETYGCLDIDNRQVEPKKPGRKKARKGLVYRRR